MVKNLQSFIAFEALLSFMKDTFYDGGSGSSATKSDLIDNNDDMGTLSISSKGKDPIFDIREDILQPCSSGGKQPICDNMEHTQNPWVSNGKEPIYDK
ncbi:hypothetical protein D1007_17724 [Hordeum vulgare]|nr:hypothetical protein D1007_17724 [Hordeum vulgare]